MIRKVLLSFLSLICILSISVGAVFAEGEPEPSPEPTPEVSEWSQLVEAVADLENAGTGVADVFIVSGGGTNTYTITLLKDIVATENDTPIVVPENINLTIDLDGYMLDRNAVNKETGAGTDEASKRIITNNGTLSIISSDTSRTHDGHIIGNVWVPGGSGNTLTGGVLCGGSGNEEGIILYSKNKNCLTLSDVNFAGNNGTGIGGLYVGSCVKITNCNFVYNVAKDGACISTQLPSDQNDENDFIDVKQSTFEHNKATNWGGVIWANYGKTCFTECHFNYNSASVGGVYNSELTADLASFIDCTFESNNVSKSGGVSTSYSEIYVDGCIIKNSSGSKGQYYGGAFLIMNGNTTMINSQFINNQGRGGGALYIKSGTTNVSNCTFDGNKALSGSAIFLQPAGTLHISSSIIKNNVTGIPPYYLDNNTGALLVNGGTCYLDGEEGDGVKIIDNVTTTWDPAKYEQTGVSVTQNGKLYISGKIIVENNGTSTNQSYNNEPHNGIKVKSGDIIVDGDLTGSSIQLDLPDNKIINVANGVNLSELNKYIKLSGERKGYIDPTGKIVVDSPESEGHMIFFVKKGSGSISTDAIDNRALAGTTVTLTYTPSNECELLSMKVVNSSDNEITVTDNSFEMPDENVFVYVEFSNLPVLDDSREAVEEIELIPHENNNNNYVEEIKKPEKKVVRTAPKVVEKKEEEPVKDISIKINDGILKANYHPNSKTFISITNLDALKSMFNRIAADLKSYKDNGNAPLYIDDLDKESIFEVIENNEEIILEPYYSFGDERYVIDEDTDRMNDFVSKITDRHGGKTIFSLELGINIMANGKKIGSINEVSQPLEYKIQLDSDAFKGNKDRYLYLVTYHKGEYSYKPLQIDGSGSVVFTSQQFSPFRVISTKTSLLVNSTSVDYVLGLFFVGVLLLVALITVLIIRNKKKRYYNSQVLVNQNIKF